MGMLKTQFHVRREVHEKPGSLINTNNSPLLNGEKETTIRFQ